MYSEDMKHKEVLYSIAQRNVYKKVEYFVEFLQYFKRFWAEIIIW